MTQEMDPDEYQEVGDELLDDPPHWLFEVTLNDQQAARVFGPQEKRNWVMWRLSKYVVGLSGRGNVSVKRYINGEWRDADDWRKLAH